MEFEHQHDWRLPNTDPEPNGFGFADTGYSNSNSDGYTDTKFDAYTHAYSGDTYTYAGNTDTDPFGFALGHVESGPLFLPPRATSCGPIVDTATSIW